VEANANPQAVRVVLPSLAGSRSRTLRACTRRDLLAAFLGLPAALAASCSRRPTLPSEGEIVGANLSLGHRLRRPPPAPSAWQRAPVVVIGAGVAGLSAAWRLKRAGFDRFVVLELEPAAGGTSRSGTRGVVPHPWGAHYLPAPMKDNRALLTLLQEMGVVEGVEKDGEPIYAEHVLCRDPHERLFAYGDWHEGLYLHAGADDEDRRQYAAFWREIDRWVGLRDGKGRRAFTLPIAAGSDDAAITALDRLSMRQWLDEKGFTSSRLRWLVEYGCRDDYGATAGEVSAWAGLFYFASRRKSPGSESQPLLSWPEGNGRLVGHLAGAVKANLRLDLAAADVRQADENTVEVTALSEDGRAVGYRAEQVIFAAPRFVGRYVLRAWRDRPPAGLSEFDYGSWVVCNLHLKGRPKEPGFPLAWDNVIRDSPSLGYVVATHQACIDFGPTIFTYYYPLTDANTTEARRQLLNLGWSEWAELALADLSRPHPDIRKLVTRLDVMRWGHAMIRPRPGFVWGSARREALLPEGGVHFAHSDLSGVALFEEAFHHGVRAADEVLARRKGER
jgi:protoporphyrinogen oxidase